MADFIGENLTGSRFERADLSGSEVVNANMSGSRFRNVNLTGFATDAWIRRAVHGDPAPWDPLDLPWDEMPDTSGVPRDRAARPALDTVHALRRDRMSTVRELVDGLTDASLDTLTEPVDAPGWPPPRSFPVRECLQVVLNEEWEHRLYAERDLTALETRP